MELTASVSFYQRSNKFNFLNYVASISPNFDEKHKKWHQLWKWWFYIASSFFHFIKDRRNLKLKKFHGCCFHFLILMPKQMKNRWKSQFDLGPSVSFYQRSNKFNFFNYVASISPNFDEKHKKWQQLWKHWFDADSRFYILLKESQI